MYNSNLDIWIAGAVAAVIVDFIVYPFDTLKTRIQSPKYEQLYKDPKTGAVRRNVLFRGLYQGVWSVVLSTIPSSGAFFTTYEAAKYTLTNASTSSPTPEQNRLPFTHSLPNPVIHGISSSSAEVVACMILTPAEVIKQNTQVVNNDNNNPDSSTKTKQHPMVQVLRRFRRHPWKLWSGYTALVGRNMPFTGLQFPIFEYVRARVTEWRRQRKASTAGVDPSDYSRIVGNPVVERAGLTGLSAMVSGTIASIVTTPIDVVKTRVMLAASEGESNGNGEETSQASQEQKKQAKKGTFAVGKQIYRDEGVRGLFRGGAIRACWTAISLSMYLSIYEGSRFYLENRRREKDGLSARSNVEGKQEEGATI